MLVEVLPETNPSQTSTLQHVQVLISASHIFSFSFISSLPHFVWVTEGVPVVIDELIYGFFLYESVDRVSGDGRRVGSMIDTYEMHTEVYLMIMAKVVFSYSVLPSHCFLTSKMVEIMPYQYRSSRKIMDA
jgi:hypothetical protein